MDEKQKIILLIDDEAMVREALEELLELEGYVVLSAEGGEAGIRLFRENVDRVGLVFLDFRMPDLSGDEVIQVLRSEKPDVPVVMTSGYNHALKNARLGQGERLDFLPKPFNHQTLIRTVKRYM